MNSDPIWRPLSVPEHEFRLLTILPASEKDDIISCTLLVASLDSEISFEALSYTWGTNSELTGIILNGQKWRVTVRLWEALHHFRQSTLPRIMFVDALCINQSDIEEKNHQVPLMARIYGQADVVRCWLGQSTSNDGRVFEMLRLSALGKCFENVIIQGKPIAITELRDLSNMLLRPYWRRAWIIQEVFLARRAQFHCGDWELDRDQFPLADDLVASLKRITFDKSHDRESEQLLIDMYMALLQSFHAFSDALSQFRVGRLHKMTCSAFTDLTPQLASVQHDHLYAFLGLLDRELSQRVVVDYSLPVQTVFRDFAFLWMIWNESASLLAHSICLSKTDIALPTWVPDFSILDRDVMHITSFFFNVNDDVEPGFCMEGNALGINGFNFDRIVSHRRAYDIGEDLSGIAEDSERAMRYHQDWRTFFEICEADYVGGGSLESAYWNTVTIERYGVPQYGGQGWLQDEHVETCQEWYEGTKMTNDVTKNVNARLLFLVGRHLFKTAKGFIGITDRNVPPEVGDEIFFLAATEMPYILRKRSPQRYSVLSSTYICGTMSRYTSPSDLEQSRETKHPQSSPHVQSKIATEWQRLWLE